MPVNERAVAPLEPVAATRQRTVELKRAWTPAKPPCSGRTREVVAEPP